MSKTYSKLNQINTQRLKERSMLLDNQDKLPIVARATDQSADQKRRQKNGNAIPIGSFVVFAAVLLILNISAFVTIRSLISDGISTARKLSTIEKLLEKNSLQIENFAKDFNGIREDFRATTYKLKVSNEKMAELEKKADGQAFVINNLVKAKDQLLSRMAKLESQKQSPE